jgi:hypothetical protein
MDDEMKMIRNSTEFMEFINKDQSRKLKKTKGK